MRTVDLRFNSGKIIKNVRLICTTLVSLLVFVGNRVYLVSRENLIDFPIKNEPISENEKIANELCDVVIEHEE